MYSYYVIHTTGATYFSITCAVNLHILLFIHYMLDLHHFSLGIEEIFSPINRLQINKCLLVVPLTYRSLIHNLNRFFA